MRLGAHVSIAGGIPNAINRQQDIDGTCGQLFTTSPQVWQEPGVTAGIISAFQDGMSKCDIEPWVVHAGYLINLATPDSSLRQRSVKNLQADIDAAEQLGIPYVNVHLGAHTGSGTQNGLHQAAEAINKLTIPEHVTLLLETDAGSGTKLGSDLRELATVQSMVSHDTGICLDTAHVFAAGYDISTSNGVNTFISELEETVGMNAVACIHLNDSKHPCGSRKDRHAHIGDGMIGTEGISAIINHPALRHLPLILETPKDGIGDPGNIRRVRELRE